MQGQQRNLCHWDENKSAAELDIATRSVMYLPRKQKWGETKEGKKCKPSSFLPVSAFKRKSTAISFPKHPVMKGFSSFLPYKEKRSNQNGK
ncbi:hypothetical protein CDAR_247621 [Caerostris darwini]|uniref:Uncharacterized protein n=1 Tax=Caerostris darwini TaxID=1538125 RepID=A0AAV4TA67_9ARAC|nr:hypothetical protein CDAR_247621 [Caerostris darwini]